MNTALINIITRVSRPALFLRCLESVNLQTYKNIHHIVTYQNDELKEFLDKFEGLYKIRVPNLKAIEGLAIKYYTHPSKDNFINPDWEWLERKPLLNFRKEDEGDKDYKPEDQITIWKENVWHTSLDHAVARKYKHFPYNIFLKIAEQHAKIGWILYLDDDDYLERNTAIEELVNEINKHDKDTLHLLPWFNPDGKLNSEIDTHNWRQMKDGMPFILDAIGGGHLCFHSKYKEYTAWDEWSGADWRTAKCLEQIIPKKNWVDKGFVKLGGNQENGVSRGH